MLERLDTFEQSRLSLHQLVADLEGLMGLLLSALPLNRLQHGTRHLVGSGVLLPWHASTSPQLIRESLSPVLERPLATFDEVLGQTRVKGFLGDVNGQRGSCLRIQGGIIPRTTRYIVRAVPQSLSKWGLSP